MSILNSSKVKDKSYIHFSVSSLFEGLLKMGIVANET